MPNDPNLPNLNEVLATKHASNKLLHSLRFAYHATCSDCGCTVMVLDEPGMLAARQLLDSGWSAVGSVGEEEALCPECGLL